MALRKYKPLPTFRDPPEPTIVLTLSEVKVLRACYMGDHIDGPSLSKVSVRIDDFIDAAAAPTGSAAGGEK